MDPVGGPHLLQRAPLVPNVSRVAAVARLEQRPGVHEGPQMVRRRRVLVDAVDAPIEVPALPFADDRDPHPDHARSRPGRLAEQMGGPLPVRLEPLDAADRKGGAVGRDLRLRVVAPEHHEHEVRAELLDDLAHAGLPVEVVLPRETRRLATQRQDPDEVRIHQVLDRRTEALGQRVSDHGDAQLARGVRLAELVGDGIGRRRLGRFHRRRRHRRLRAPPGEGSTGATGRGGSGSGTIVSSGNAVFPKFIIF